MSAAGSTKIWTQYNIKPAHGAAPSAAADGAYFSYVNADGFLVVYDSGAAYTLTT